MFALIVMFTFCSILFTACGSSPAKTESGVYNVRPGEIQQIKIELQQNERLDITVDVEIVERSGDGAQTDETIGLRITSPKGDDIVSYMRIGFGEFMVLAEEGGNYIVTLDNSQSQSTYKRIQVILTYS